eukprot:scaffold223433_cov41-Attheya_sp.AAC.1
MTSLIQQGDQRYLEPQERDASIAHIGTKIDAIDHQTAPQNSMHIWTTSRPIPKKATRIHSNRKNETL